MDEFTALLEHIGRNTGKSSRMHRILEVSVVQSDK
jgi:hypothetical protein